MLCTSASEGFALGCDSWPCHTCVDETYMMLLHYLFHLQVWLSDFSQGVQSVITTDPLKAMND